MSHEGFGGESEKSYICICVYILIYNPLAMVCIPYKEKRVYRSEAREGTCIGNKTRQVLHGPPIARVGGTGTPF